MGAGKSTLSALLIPKLPRTGLLGIDKIKWFLSDFERTDADNAIIGKVMLAMAKAFLEQDCNVLIDQAFWKIEYVQPFIDLANERGAKLHFYQLEAPVEVLRERIKNRPIKPGRPPYPEGRVENNLKLWGGNRYELGQTFDTSKVSLESIADIILQDVSGAVQPE